MSLREERQRLLGRIGEAKLELQRLRIVGDGYMVTIRTKLCPHDEIDNLDIDVAAASMQELLKAWTRARELAAQIKKWEADLG